MSRRQPSRVNYDFTPPAHRVWSGIEADEPPTARYDYAHILALAQSMLAQRERLYPKMIERGQITSEAAAINLATFGHIVDEWRWVVTGEGNPAPIGSWPARVAALDEAISNIADIAQEAGCFTPDLAAKADLVIAMRWWMDLDHRLSLHSITRLNHALRAGTFSPQEMPHAA
jgi:hypothetical protein